MKIGIDPGWASFGISVEHEGKSIFTASYVPREHGTILGFIDFLNGELTKADPNISMTVTDIYIERYVAYKGIHSDASEQILMLIGALNYFFSRLGAVHMVRAIDWKPNICKYLVRTQGFNNKYPSFDKRFSIQAAEALAGRSTKVDHEADAVCLSYLGAVEDYRKNKGVKQ